MQPLLAASCTLWHARGQNVWVRLESPTRNQNDKIRITRNNEKDILPSPIRTVRRWYQVSNNFSSESTLAMQSLGEARIKSPIVPPNGILKSLISSHNASAASGPHALLKPPPFSFEWSPPGLELQLPTRSGYSPTKSSSRWKDLVQSPNLNGWTFSVSLRAGYFSRSRGDVSPTIVVWLTTIFSWSEAGRRPWLFSCL